MHTLPSQRPPRRAGRGGTPRYGQIPGWGLFDEATVPPAESADREPAGLLRRCLQLVWPVLAVAAAMQLLRYVVLMVNRSRPIPYWLDITTLWLLLLSGAAALAAAVLTIYVVARWMLRVREESYAGAGYAEPRRRWEVVALTVIPFLNVAGAPLLLREAADAAGGAAVQQARAMITRVAVAWALVSVVGLIALIYRILAWNNAIVQTGADAMLWATLTLALSALFAYWLGPRLSRLAVDDGHADDDAPAPRRLVVAA